MFKAGAAGDAALGTTVFQVWTGAEFVQQCTAAGFPVVASPSEVWYLDHADNTAGACACACVFLQWRRLRFTLLQKKRS